VTKNILSKFAFFRPNPKPDARRGTGDSLDLHRAREKLLQRQRDDSKARQKEEQKKWEQKQGFDEPASLASKSTSTVGGIDGVTGSTSMNACIKWTKLLEKNESSDMVDSNYEKI
jgi:hypothetical protein